MRERRVTGRDLLVASAGGHLTQLWMLAERMQPSRPRTWVSYDHPHSRGLLADDEFVHGHGPSTRSARALWGNWRLARRMLSSGRYDRVISTGAAIAVPFLLTAERRGIEAHYVESATRTDAPSLSGRLLERLTGDVRLHTQYPEWADDRWSAVSWVFDGFRPVVAPEEQPDNGGLRIVVSLGTHDYEFRRLVDAVLAATRREDRVLVQHGATRLPAELPPGVEASPLVPTRRFAAELDEAHVVVAHAGTGIALSALEAGRRPVLVPRSSEHDEHVDDHQQLTAQRLGGLNLAAVVTPEELTRDTLLEAAAWRVEQVSDKRPLSLSA